MNIQLSESKKDLNTLIFQEYEGGIKLLGTALANWSIYCLQSFYYSRVSHICAAAEVCGLGSINFILFTLSCY